MPDISDYIRGGYPCLHVETTEYETAPEKILAALMERDKGDLQLVVWKITNGAHLGTVAGGLDSLDQGRRVAEDLPDTLQWVEANNQETALIIHNIQDFVESPIVQQSLLDAALMARFVGSYIFLVGPYFDLPPALNSIVTRHRLPLPTHEELTELFTSIATRNADVIYHDGETLKSRMKKDKLTADQTELLCEAARCSSGLDRISAENAFCLSTRMSSTQGIDLTLLQSQKAQEVAKSDVLELVLPSDGLDNVGGFAALKAWLTRRRRAFSQEARDYGLPFPKGILIGGAAGTGKSLASKATSAYLGLPLLRLDIGRVFRSLVGSSEAAIRQALTVAEAVAPVVLWVDELDKALAGHDSSGNLDSGVTSRVVGTLLTWRAETKAAVMLVATANNVMSLPSMVLRKGRLDELWSVDLPTEDERAEIFNIHLRKRKRDPEKFDVPLLAQRTEDWTGSEIEAAIEDAMFFGFDADREFTTKDILRAIKSTVPQVKRAPEEIEAVRAWAEKRARPVAGDTKTKKSAGRRNNVRTIK